LTVLAIAERNDAKKGPCRDAYTESK